MHSAKKPWVSGWGPNTFLLFGGVGENGRRKNMISLYILDMFRSFQDINEEVTSRHLVIGMWFSERGLGFGWFICFRWLSFIFSLLVNRLVPLQCPFLFSLFSTLLLELRFEKCKPDIGAPLVKQKEPTVFSHYVHEKVQNSLPTSPFLSYP